MFSASMSGYRLNDPDYNVEYFTMTGTPTAILAAILAGTPFAAITVEFSTAITISILEETSRRGLLMYLVSYLGGDLYCNGFGIYPNASWIHYTKALSGKDMSYQTINKSMTSMVILLSLTHVRYTKALRWPWAMWYRLTMRCSALMSAYALLALPMIHTTRQTSASR